MAFPAAPGFEFDGILGYDFIKQFVIEIDYLNQFMNLYDPRAYALRRKGRGNSASVWRRKNSIFADEDGF